MSLKVYTITIAVMEQNKNMIMLYYISLTLRLSELLFRLSMDMIQKKMPDLPKENL
jgi:hypothetical protein